MSLSFLDSLEKVTGLALVHSCHVLSWPLKKVQIGYLQVLRAWQTCWSCFFIPLETVGSSGARLWTHKDTSTVTGWNPKVQYVLIYEDSVHVHMEISVLYDYLSPKSPGRLGNSTGLFPGWTWWFYTCKVHEFWFSFQRPEETLFLLQKTVSRSLLILKKTMYVHCSDWVLGKISDITPITAKTHPPTTVYKYACNANTVNEKVRW